MTVTMQGYFGGFCNFPSFLSAKVPKSSNNDPIIVKINGKDIFSYKMSLLMNCHTVALDAVDVKIRVLQLWLSAVTL